MITMQTATELHKLMMEYKQESYCGDEVLLERSAKLDVMIQDAINASPIAVSARLQYAAKRASEDMHSDWGLCHQILRAHMGTRIVTEAQRKFSEECGKLLVAIMLKWAFSKPETQWCDAHYPVNSVQAQTEGFYKGWTLAAVIDELGSEYEVSSEMGYNYKRENGKMHENKFRIDLMAFINTELETIVQETCNGR